MNSAMTIKVVIEYSSGTKFVAIPDLIAYLEENSQNVSPDVKEFVHKTIVAFSTLRSNGEKTAGA